MLNKTQILNNHSQTSTEYQIQIQNKHKIKFIKKYLQKLETGKMIRLLFNLTI